MTTIDQIRQKIQNRDYYLSSHTEDEMVDDYLERQDVEYAILYGRVEKIMTHDRRGTRYRIEGSTIDLLHKCKISPHPPTPSPKLGRRGAAFKVPLSSLGEGFRVRAGIRAGGLMDGRLIHVICRFRDKGSLIIITVYALTEDK